jgi:hypothetical protein
MTVRLILQFLGKSGIVLFEGLSSECPPIPRPGDEILHEKALVRVECVRHHYWANQVEVMVVSSSLPKQAGTSA